MKQAVQLASSVTILSLTGCVRTEDAFVKTRPKLAPEVVWNSKEYRVKDSTNIAIHRVDADFGRDVKMEYTLETANRVATRFVTMGGWMLADLDQDGDGSIDWSVVYDKEGNAVMGMRWSAGLPIQMTRDEMLKLNFSDSP